MNKLIIACSLLTGLLWGCNPSEEFPRIKDYVTYHRQYQNQQPRLAQGMIAGEPTQYSIILQARLTALDSMVQYDIPGAEGVGRFELSRAADFRTIDHASPLLTSRAEDDFVLKHKADPLLPATRYYYRLQHGKKETELKPSHTGMFQTLPEAGDSSEVEFVAVSCMDYHRFYHGFEKRGMKPYRRPDKALGFPVLEQIYQNRPDFVVFTGDNVYYDHPKKGVLRALDVHTMRAKWHRVTSMPRFQQLAQNTGTYWMKDDHDFRYNDADLTDRGGEKPGVEEGLRVFREQIPVVDPADPRAKTYRTYRINALLQIWMVEGRDYRHPNEMEPGPGKSLWGAEQKAWLKQTLADSDAVFKLLISPTPLIGPDRPKSDNHSQPLGFKAEGQEFFKWLKEQSFSEKNFYILSGDRHWQYHAQNHYGFEEFSCGTMIDNLAARGPKAEALPPSDERYIRQYYLNKQLTGGFLKVNIYQIPRPGITFSFFDELGEELYIVSREAQ